MHIVYERKDLLERNKDQGIDAIELHDFTDSMDHITKADTVIFLDDDRQYRIMKTRYKGFLDNKGYKGIYLLDIIIGEEE